MQNNNNKFINFFIFVFFFIIDIVLGSINENNTFENIIGFCFFYFLIMWFFLHEKRKDQWPLVGFIIFLIFNNYLGQDLKMYCLLFMLGIAMCLDDYNENETAVVSLIYWSYYFYIKLGFINEFFFLFFICMLLISYIMIMFNDNERSQNYIAIQSIIITYYVCGILHYVLNNENFIGFTSLYVLFILIIFYKKVFYFIKYSTDTQFCCVTYCIFLLFYLNAPQCNINIAIFSSLYFMFYCLVFDVDWKHPIKSFSNDQLYVSFISAFFVLIVALLGDSVIRFLITYLPLVILIYPDIFKWIFGDENNKDNKEKKNNDEINNNNENYKINNNKIMEDKKINTKKNYVNFFLSSGLIYIFLIIFLIINIMWILFDELVGTFQYNYAIDNGTLLIRFGIDSISFFFIYLTGLLIPLTMLFSLISRNTMEEKKNNIFLLFTVGILLLIVFYVLDLLLFYISFEAILVPFFVYIGVTGYRKRRIHAAYLFFFYTLVGSFFMLISIFFIYLSSGSTDIEMLWNVEWANNLYYLLWFALFITFAIKVPMFPFHVWLPEAHVEAPTEGSVLLAGLLLKLGTYGFMRFLFPLFSKLNYYFSPSIMMIASIGIIYTSFTTLRQVDIKRIIAYSSIAHMNMCILGLFSYNETAFIGSIFLMIAHGIVSGGLFFLIGIIYNRYRTKIIHYFSGVIHFMPIMCFYFFLLLLGNIGLPGTSNFVGELLILNGILYQGYIIGVFAAIIGIFLCTVYSMLMFNKIAFLFPKLSNVTIPDLYFFEMIILTPLVVLMFFLGIFPTCLFSLLDFIIIYNWIELFN
jgi:proton-translocating NADH-quinone oxidoreductase chain M